MNWDRFLSVANLTVLIVGSVAAGYEWLTFKQKYDEQTLSQIALANKQLSIALGTDEQKPYDYSGDLTIIEVKKFADGTSLYDVTFDVTSKNTSKSLIRVSYSSAELYLGDPSIKELTPGSAASINDSPDPWHPQDSGLLSWRRIAYEAHVDEGPTNSTVLKWMGARYTSIGHGGALTGILESGTSTEYAPEYLIRAKPNQYVSFVVSFGIDDSLDAGSPNVGLISNTEILADADTGQDGVVVARSAPGIHATAKLKKNQRRDLHHRVAATTSG
ncbi:hypothetical protein [Paraburkholderia sp. GAS348]|uniref:hypothetical protein n=1 Tax=Paraburkholderia sp. GAS348 TaxID=3035132 RepID=UPI003D1B04CF